MLLKNIDIRPPCCSIILRFLFIELFCGETRMIQAGTVKGKTSSSHMGRSLATVDEINCHACGFRWKSWSLLLARVWWAWKFNRKSFFGPILSLTESFRDKFSFNTIGCEARVALNWSWSYWVSCGEVEWMSNFVRLMAETDTVWGSPEGWSYSWRSFKSFPGWTFEDSRPTCWNATERQKSCNDAVISLVLMLLLHVLLLMNNKHENLPAKEHQPPSKSSPHPQTNIECLKQALSKRTAICCRCKVTNCELIGFNENQKTSARLDRNKSPVDDSPHVSSFTKESAWSERFWCERAID